MSSVRIPIDPLKVENWLNRRFNTSDDTVWSGGVFCEAILRDTFEITSKYECGNDNSDAFIRPRHTYLRRMEDELGRHSVEYEELTADLMDIKMNLLWLEGSFVSGVSVTASAKYLGKITKTLKKNKLTR